jgi:recombination protein RecT
MSLDKIMSLVDIAGSQERFDKYKSAVARVLPKTMETEKDRYWTMYVQMMQTFATNPKITDKRSILNCMFNAPKMGLIPDPVMGQIYFIPYKGVLTYQIGYKGMIALAYRSGKVANVRAGLVYEKDKWNYYEDEKGQHYHIEPLLTTPTKKDRGKEIFGYSIFTDSDGNPNIHIMESWHIEDIKKLVMARMSGSSTPWSNPLFEPEMRKKTVIRRHWKTEPMSVEIARVIDNEEHIEQGKIFKEQHPELEGIIDDILAKNEEQVVPEMSAENAEFLKAMDAPVKG